jgi:hypothetical protein
VGVLAFVAHPPSGESARTLRACANASASPLVSEGEYRAFRSVVLVPPCMGGREPHRALMYHFHASRSGEKVENTGGNGQEWRGTAAGGGKGGVARLAAKSRIGRRFLAAIPRHSIPCGVAMLARALSLQNRYSPVRFRPAPLCRATTYEAIDGSVRVVRLAGPLFAGTDRSLSRQRASHERRADSLRIG